MSYVIVQVVCGEGEVTRDVFVIIENRAREVRGPRYPGLLHGNYGKLDYDTGGTGGWSGHNARHCHCDLCYVKWFDPSYDYLSNFLGLISTLCRVILISTGLKF